MERLGKSQDFRALFSYQKFSARNISWFGIPRCVFDENWWKFFLQTSRTSLNLPGPLNPLINPSFQRSKFNIYGGVRLIVRTVGKSFWHQTGGGARIFGIRPEAEPIQYYWDGKIQFYSTTGTEKKQRKLLPTFPSSVFPSFFNNFKPEINRTPPYIAITQLIYVIWF